MHYATVNHLVSLHDFLIILTFVLTFWLAIESTALVEKLFNDMLKATEAFQKV